MQRTLLVAVFLINALFGAAHSAPQDQGSWTQLKDFPDAPYFPIHVHLLPSGKVMVWPGGATEPHDKGDDPRIWNPADESVTTLTKAGYNIFCSGHTFLPDGRLFVAGGHVQPNEGLPQAAIYDSTQDKWTQLPNMKDARWYPTATALPNGDVVVVSGRINNIAGQNNLPQVFEVSTGNWRDLTSAVLSLPNYPRLFVAPNGKIFNAGPAITTRYLDTAGTGGWSTVANRIGPDRANGSAVMYAPGKILTMGGNDPPTNTAEVIDLNQANPTWRAVASMNFARRHPNSVILPDGKVLVTGGTFGPGRNNPDTPVFAAELWDPTTETWTEMASASIPRLYHSTSLLLPDGKVLTTGGDGKQELEVYEPPYLFNGTRPTITSAPASAAYGESFFVETADAASITKVRMIRLSSTTHSFNMSQHPAEPGFSQATGGLNVTAPANGNVAPPGHYLLFILNGSGIPSIAKIVQIGAGAPPPPPPPAPTLTSLQPNSATAGGAAFTLTVNGTNFVNGTSAVRWNGANRTTSFVSATQLTASIPASDIASAGTAQVTVANGSDVSSALTFTITSTGGGTPTVSSLSPNTVTVGGAAFTLTVNGTNFVTSSVVRWNGANRTTTFVSATQLTAAIPASDITTTGTKYIRVANGSLVSSPAAKLQVTSAPSPTPTVTSLSPGTVKVNGPAFTLTVNGTNFVNGTSIVRWNGSNRPTTFVSATQLTAAIPASDITTTGDKFIRVANGSLVSAPAVKLKVTQ